MKAGDYTLSWKKNLGIIAAFTGTVIGTIHIINRIFTYIATADDHLNKDSYSYYDWRFGKIAYKKQGEGKPLLLIHDFNVCSSSYEWNKIEKKLAKNNKHCIFDRLVRMRMFRSSHTYLYQLLICTAHNRFYQTCDR